MKIFLLVSIALFSMFFPSFLLASVQSVYVREGDPLRFVWEVRGRRNMGIICEGKLRATCFVIGTAYIGISLNQRQRPEERPQSIQELAQVLDLHPKELPKDLIDIWRGPVNWPSFESDGHFPINDVKPSGPYHLVCGRARIYILEENRGYVHIYQMGESSFRVHRLPPPGKHFTIRPRAGLMEMMKHYDLILGDICVHLERIDEGRPVDWSNLHFYSN